ncbi:MAG TPA: ATP-grasp domain-containing protein, partial [bacterium]|nr:ATP-grasp domain-containing protein [bacterium]
MTTVLVLGASIWQVPLMDAARRLGLTVAATDRDPRAAGASAADHFAPVDLRDIPGTIAYARQLGVAAVATDQTDIAVPTQAAVAAALGLRGPSPETALNATHKRRMRELSSAAGILNPGWVALRSGVGLPLQWADPSRPAAIVKPADSMGSRGVQVVEDLNHFEGAVRAALGYSPSGEALVEEFLEGTEVTIEGLVDAEGPKVLAISEKRHSPPPHRTAWHLNFPPRMDAATLGAIRDAAVRTAAALGITSGPLHGEFMVTGRGVYLIEMANRGGGSGTSSHIVPAATGVDLLELNWRQLLGETAVATPTCDRAVILRFLNYPAGAVTRIEGAEEAAALPGTVLLRLNISEGDHLGAVTNDTQRHGCAIVVGDTLDDAEAALGAVQ